MVHSVKQNMDSSKTKLKATKQKKIYSFVARKGEGMRSFSGVFFVFYGEKINKISVFHLLTHKAERTQVWQPCRPSSFLFALSSALARRTTEQHGVTAGAEDTALRL